MSASLLANDGGSAAAPTPPTIESGSLRLLTYNVNFAFARWAVDHPERRSRSTSLILQAVEQSNADVVALQETHEGYEALVRRRLSKVYPYQLWHHSAAAGGSACLSRYPIEDSELARCSDAIDGSWFDQLCVRIRLDDLHLVLGIVHLRPPINSSGWAHPLTMSWTSGIRASELEMVCESMQQLEDRASKQRIVKMIAGDFNENDGHSAIESITGAGFSDALHQVQGHTHWWPLKLAFFTYILRSRLDHILFQEESAQLKGIEIVEGYEGDASDHLPVLASFEV